MKTLVLLLISALLLPAGSVSVSPSEYQLENEVTQMNEELQLLENTENVILPAEEIDANAFRNIVHDAWK